MASYTIAPVASLGRLILDIVGICMSIPITEPISVTTPLKFCKNELSPSITKFTAPSSMEITPLKTPLKISLTPFHARSQSPVNTPVINCIRPLKVCCSPFMIPPIAPNTSSNAGFRLSHNSVINGDNTPSHKN